MDLDRYVADLHSQLAASAEAGGEETRALAERLATALDAAARLALLEALSDAASEITRDLAPGSVDMRLRGRDPEFVVSPPLTPGFADTPATQAPAGAGPGTAAIGDDTVTSRTTLRLPDQLKAQAERAAARDGLSLNSWLVRAIAAAVAAAVENTSPEPRNQDAGSRRDTRRGKRSGDSFTGWVS